MPYIPQERREKFKAEVDALKALSDREDLTTGDINYIVSSFIYHIFDKKPSYAVGSSMRAALNDAAAEFYRRKLAGYEDEKKEENGDV